MALPAGARIYSRARFAWIQAEPHASRGWLGYLGLGGSVALRGGSVEAAKVRDARETEKREAKAAEQARVKAEREAEAARKAAEAEAEAERIRAGKRPVSKPALSATEQKAIRDARYAARKARKK